jgi:hypothetical protein
VMLLLLLTLMTAGTATLTNAQKGGISCFSKCFSEGGVHLTAFLASRIISCVSGHRLLWLVVLFA